MQPYQRVPLLRVGGRRPASLTFRRKRKKKRRNLITETGAKRGERRERRGKRPLMAPRRQEERNVLRSPFYQR